VTDSVSARRAGKRALTELLMAQPKNARCVLHEECRTDEAMGKACFRETIARMTTMTASEVKAARAALNLNYCTKCTHPGSMRRHTCARRAKDKAPR
jgi:hypothetical protein